MWFAAWKLMVGGWSGRRAVTGHLKHPKKAMVVTVPGNWNDDLPVGTLKSILRKAELNES